MGNPMTGGAAPTARTVYGALARTKCSSGSAGQVAGPHGEALAVRFRFPLLLVRRKHSRLRKVNAGLMAVLLQQIK